MYNIWNFLICLVPMLFFPLLPLPDTNSLYLCSQWRNISRWWWLTPAGEEFTFCGWKWQSWDASSWQPDLGPGGFWPHRQNSTTWRVSKLNLALSFVFCSSQTPLLSAPFVRGKNIPWVGQQLLVDAIIQNNRVIHDKIYEVNVKELQEADGPQIAQTNPINGHWFLAVHRLEQHYHSVNSEIWGKKVSALI